jgi:hypothetical protein
VLVDSLGNDSYSGGYGGTNGGAMAEGSGYLVDLGGHDTYTSSGTGVNGGGFTGGVGYLNDVSGNDHYSAGQCAVNGGGWTGSCYGTVTSAGSGTLLDNSGDDTYSDGDGGSGSNVTIAAKGTAGRQIDGPSQGPGAPTLLTLGEVAIHGTAALPKFPCEPPPPLGNGPCAGSFDGDWAANVSGIRNGNVFSATWNTASGHAIHAGFDYSEWQCLAGTETLLGIAAGTGSATVAPGELQGKWQVPGESFARDIVGATASFTFTWNRVATGAVLSLSPTTLSLDVAGLGPQVVVTGAQLGVATLVVTSTGNTTVPMCGTPLTNVRGDIAGVVWLAS